MSNLQLAKNYVAEVAIPPFRIVKLGTADDRVTLATSTSDFMIGTSMDIAAAAGERIDVQFAQIAFVEVGTAILRGQPVTSDAVGRGIAAAPVAGSNNAIIGRALESASAAGDIIRVMQSIGVIQGYGRCRRH